MLSRPFNSLRYACLAETLNIPVQLQRILDVKEPLARKAARESRLSPQKLCDGNPHFLLPLHVPKRSHPVGKGPVVTVWNPNGFLRPPDCSVEVPREDLRERPVRVERPALGIVGAEVDRPLEMRDGLGVAAFVGQRVAKTAVDGRQAGVEFEGSLQLGERVSIGLPRQQNATMNEADERVLVIELHALLGKALGFVQRLVVSLRVEVEHTEDDSIGKKRESLRQFRIERRGAAQQLLRLPVVFSRELVEVHQSEMIQVPGLQCLAGFPLRTQALGVAHARLDARSDGPRDLVLQLENLLELTIILLSPHELAAFGFDQMCRYPHARPDLANATFHDVIGAQLRADAAYVAAVSLEREC